MTCGRCSIHVPLGIGEYGRYRLFMRTTSRGERYENREAELNYNGGRIPRIEPRKRTWLRRYHFKGKMRDRSTTDTSSAIDLTASSAVVGIVLVFIILPHSPIMSADNRQGLLFICLWYVTRASPSPRLSHLD